MVQFNFKLSDVDAQNLFDILQSEHCRMLENAIHTPSASEAEWFRDHAKYITELKAKLKNKRIEK